MFDAGCVACEPARRRDGARMQFAVSSAAAGFVSGAVSAASPGNLPRLSSQEQMMRL